MKKNKATLLILIVTLLLTLTGCEKLTYSITEHNPDIVCEIECYDALAKITVKDTYTLSGEKYYSLYFTLNKPITDDTPAFFIGTERVYSYDDFYYNSPLFDISESEYERYFGLGNDAFTTTVYQATCKNTLLKYDTHFFDLEKTLYIEGGQQHFDYTSTYSKANRWADDNAEIFIKDNYDEAIGEIKKIRFSVFGEENFNESEIKQIQFDMNSMYQKFITEYIER